MKFFVLNFLFLISLSAFAESLSHFSAQDLKLIEQDLKISSYLYRVSKEVDEMSLQPISDSKWIKHLEDRSMQLMHMRFSDNEARKIGVEKWRSYIKWETWWDHTKELSRRLRSYTRLNGLGTAFALVTTAPSEIYGPIIMMAIGAPELAPIAAAFPLSTIAVGGQIAVKKVFMRQELISAFGSKEKFLEFERAIKEHQQMLKIRSYKDYVHKIGEFKDELELVVINQESIFSVWWNKLFPSKKPLTFSKVKKFCEDLNLVDDNEFVKHILTDKSLPKEHRAGLILEHLRHIQDDHLREALDEFIDSSRIYLNASKELDEVYYLSKKILEVGSYSELRKLLIQDHPNINFKIFLSIWQDRLLEELSEKLDDVNHFEFRRLMNNITKLSGEIKKIPMNVYMSGSWKDKFIEYLDKSKSPKLTCEDAVSPL